MASIKPSHFSLQGGLEMRKQNVAYLRVSTEAQTEKYGLDMQKQKILEYCDREGVMIDKWYIDGGYSGSKLDRPGIQQLLKDAENGLIGTVHIYKLDRMSRDVIDTLNIICQILPKYDVKVVSMTEEIRIESPTDRMMLTINAAVNQHERETIRMRMSAGMVERVKKGYWMGGGNIPYGYYYDRNDGILHIKPDEAEVVRNAYRLYLDGYACDRISKMLGFKWERIVIQILKRKSNLGLIEYKGEVYKGLHEPIIDEKTFYQTQELMKKRSTNSHVSNNNLLTGLCYCGVCGARMRYQKWGKYHKLICYSQQTSKDYMVKDPNCNNIKPKAYEIEDEVESWFKEFSITVDQAEEKVSDTTMIESAIKKSSAKIKNLYNLYADSPSDNLLEVIQEEEKRVSDLKEQYAEEKSKEHNVDTEKIERIKKVSDVWDKLSNEDKNRVLKECVEKIVITGNDVEIRFVTF